MTFVACWCPGIAETFLGAPVVVDDDTLEFDGVRYRHKYRAGELGWVSQLIDEQMHREAADGIDDLRMWVSDTLVAAVASADEPARDTDGSGGMLMGQLLAFVPPPGSRIETRRMLGTWYLLEVSRDRVIQSFCIASSGRRLVKRLVFTSNTLLCLHELPQDVDARRHAWLPDARYVAGLGGEARDRRQRGR